MRCDAFAPKYKQNCGFCTPQIKLEEVVLIPKSQSEVLLGCSSVLFLYSLVRPEPRPMYVCPLLPLSLLKYLPSHDHIAGVSTRCTECIKIETIFYSWNQS